MVLENPSQHTPVHAVLEQPRARVGPVVLLLVYVSPWRSDPLSVRVHVELAETESFENGGKEARAPFWRRSV